MSLKYRISKRALQDLDEIWHYTFNKWSAEQADNYYNILINEIELIAQDLYVENLIFDEALPFW